MFKTLLNKLVVSCKQVTKFCGHCCVFFFHECWNKYREDLLFALVILLIMGWRDLVLNKTQAQTSQSLLDCHHSWIIMPTYDIRSEKSKNVIRVNQMRFRLSLLNRTFTKLRVGMMCPLLRTGSVKCRCECWNNSISRGSLIG